MLRHFLRSNKEQLPQPCEEWFLAHRHRLLSYARQQVDGMTDVEVLLHDTARRVTRAYCEGRVPLSELMPYTLRSLYNAARDMRARNARRLEAERRYGHAECKADTPHGMNSPHASEDVHQALRRAIYTLPQELASVLTLRIWGEHSFAEIAEMLSLSESTARRRYTAALAQIRLILQEQTHEPER